MCEMKVEMKHMAVAALAALLLVCACTKFKENPYATSIWSGEFPTQTQNGTTGELEDQTGVICLYFRKDAEECIVETGIAGLFAVNRKTYQARWSNQVTFTLYESAEGQSLDCYSGGISGSTLTLQALNCDGVAATYKLYRVLPE